MQEQKKTGTKRKIIKGVVQNNYADNNAKSLLYNKICKKRTHLSCLGMKHGAI